MKKKGIALLLTGVIMASCSMPVYADREDAKLDVPYISLGADLNAQEKASVLELLGVSEKDLEDYTVATVTNKDEHNYLDSYLDKSVIGSRALSSVLVEGKEDGNGIHVTTKNITYCTPGMYENALATAGIKDADIVVAGPFKISGTAALVGAIKSYENMTGEEVKEENGLLTYIGTRLDTEESGVALREVFLDSKLVFSKPQDRLFAGQIDRMDRFALRYRARKYSSEQFRMPYSGLRGQRTSLIPHQLNIAHDVGRRHAPRVLLADEVGLGKTIEAGMILHQQLLSGAAERVLIIVPETLQHQWLVEMLRRFNLRFALFDDERYAEAQHDAYNPFDTEQLVICSLDFARRSKQRLEHLCEAEWDLLVVDEAHHLVWSEDAPSREYQAIEQLAEHVPGVLLLTATPEQLGMESHFARLRLLDPNRFHDFAQFVEEQKNYRPVADAVAMLLAGNKLSNDELNDASATAETRRILIFFVFMSIDFRS